MNALDDPMSMDDVAASVTCANCGSLTNAPLMRVNGDFVACEHCGHDVHTRQNFNDWAGGKRQNTAANFLSAAAAHMQNRASTYDKCGERSMRKTVSAFNTITGAALTEEQGWLLMGILKMVRSQQGEFRADNYEDEAAYAALRGECASQERSQ